MIDHICKRPPWQWQQTTLMRDHTHERSPWWKRTHERPVLWKPTPERSPMSYTTLTRPDKILTHLVTHTHVTKKERTKSQWQCNSTNTEAVPRQKMWQLQSTKQWQHKRDATYRQNMNKSQALTTVDDNVPCEKSPHPPIHACTRAHTHTHTHTHLLHTHTHTHTHTHNHSNPISQLLSLIVIHCNMRHKNDCQK